MAGMLGCGGGVLSQFPLAGSAQYVAVEMLVEPEAGMIDFKGRQFDRSVILLCVRWYLAYGLSLRNLNSCCGSICVSAP
jgi:hypothetical protein